MANKLLYPFESALGHIDYFNKMLVDRIRGGATRITTGVKRTCIRRWAPLLLVLILIVYLFMGSGAFWVFEHENHEHSVQKWYMNQAVNRRQFARTISTRIFNDTRNLLIIIDREQTERVQQLLVESLKNYEGHLALKKPDRKEWTWLSAFNFAYGLLLTVGHGAKIPETTVGQVFALGYCLLGVPLFYSTLAVCLFAVLRPFLESTSRNVKRRLLVLNLALLLYVIWGLLLALFLYYTVLDSFWASVFTAFISGLTIQIPSYESLTPPRLLVLLAACTVSAAFLVAAAILSAAVFSAGEPQTPSKMAPLLEQEPQKFTIIVDEAGDSKLVDSAAQ